MELVLVNYDVADAINDTVQLNVIRSDTVPVQFVLKVDENVPSTLFSDALRIRQILNNILPNAFKYTDYGEVILLISAELPEAPGPGEPVMIILSVSDTGRGMTQEQLDKLFDDYSRFMDANCQIEGTGLDMSITKHFIDMMNGEITVKSEPGKGTEFTIRVPQGYVDSGVLGKEGVDNLQRLCAGRGVKQKLTTDIIRDYMPYGKVLVVDDMEPNLYIIEMLLSPYGLAITNAASGMEAIEKIKSSLVFDIIFMDYYMPEMDGTEATKIIRGPGYKAPIVALNANALVGQEKFFLENSFDEFFSKPIDIRQLDSTLNKFVRDKYPAETVEAARELKKQQGEENPELPDLSQLKALIVDNEKVKKIYCDKFKIYFKVLRSYLDVVPKSLEKMSQVTEEALPVYVVSVHGVKNVSDFIGAEEA
jgi:CheY-like chemotaxis protein